ncbi:hypothetical protein BCR42DRAFT_411234 [Absidia repens]|uniref:Uncharacterized protein n=1 Tax=Absidia repens TaxID=90262 RepID=A0A1X2ILG2_9FUNG|nr:hypothetical protein BCR42DRAFT_411234 [Absidia repens]
MMVDLKRKRRDSGVLRVRFCTEPCKIIDTYSPFEYNRGGLFPDIDHDEENDTHYQHASDYNHNNIILTFSFGFMSPTSSRQSHQSPATPILPSQTSSAAAKRNKGDKKKPKLSIDTSNIQDGPLYFTNMTTNHQKNEQAPLTAIGDDDLDAKITMENTEINRRCLVAAV